jgi:sulfopyruvate decarboxylase alpha subunit
MTMNWAETIVQSLKDSDVSLVAYVPDISIHQVTKLLEDDPYFHLVYATREEEAIGIASGAYAVGRKAAVFMQSSGFGNVINALASLCIPCRIPIPMFINMRGEVGEFNIAQVAMGRATRPILDVLGLPYYTLDTVDRLDQQVTGALTLCYASRQPLALCLTPMLHGGKIA